MFSFQQLGRRKLLQWVLAYLAGGWVFLQVLDLFADNFGWPSIVERIATVVLAAGLLAVTVIAWYHGEKGVQRATAPELALLAAIVVIAGVSIALVTKGYHEEDRSARSTAEENSMAVLPFVNVSSDNENEYFSDGLTEELINALTKIEGLRVPARTSVFAYKDKNLDVRDIGRQLNVATVLEGSVRKSGDQIRISAQLIKVADGYHLWSQTFDRKMSDVFEVQQEIAQGIVDALALQPGVVGKLRLFVDSTDADTYNAYLQARYYWNNRGVSHADFFQMSCEKYSEVAARDSSYAPGWAGLADCYYLGYGGRSGAMQRARAAARQALARNPRLSGPHSAMAQTYVAEGDWKRAEQEHRAAIMSDPRDALAFQRYALMLTWRGSHDSAMTMIQRAQQIDPASIVVRRDHARILLHMRRYDDAIAATNSGRALNPAFGGSAAEAYLMKGMYKEALAEAGRRSSSGYNRALRGYILARLGQRDSALQIARALELHTARDSAREIDVALLYAGLGDRDRAFQWIDNQFAASPFAVAHELVEPMWDPLRNDPRWGRARKRVNLPLQ